MLRLLIVLVVIAVLLGVALGLPSVLKPSLDVDFFAPQSVHWHAELYVEINGVEVPVPAGVGLPSAVLDDKDDQAGGRRPQTSESPVHTHDGFGVLHIEVADYVKQKDQTTLGFFFKVWKKRLTDSCLFEYCTDESHQLRFFVNGVERFDWQTYLLQDDDVLDLLYERIPLEVNTRL